MVNIFNKNNYILLIKIYTFQWKIHFFYECLNYIKKKKLLRMVEKKLFELGLNGPKEKKIVRIGSDFLIGPNGPREIWCGQWAGSKKKGPI